MSNNVTLPGTGEPVETEQQPDGSHRQRITIADIAAKLELLVAAFKFFPLVIDGIAARLRINLEAIGGVLLATGVGASSTGTPRVVTATDSTIATVTTVTTVTTVSTVTSMSQVGGVPANSFIADMQYLTYAMGVRSRIT